MEKNYKNWSSLFDIMNGYIHSQALITAVELGIFDLLHTHRGITVEDIQTKIKLKPYPARVLMLGICNTGLVYKNPETKGYYNSPAAEELLIEHKPHSMIPFVKFNDRIQRKCLLHLTNSVKNNTNEGLKEFPGEGHTLYERFSHYPELEVLFQEALGAYTYWLSQPLWELKDFENVEHLLDIGGGDGTNAISLCERYPHLQVTILDRPSVCAQAEINVSKKNLKHRIRCVGLDVFQDAWPAGCDAVLASHFVEIFSPEKIQKLYSKIHNYLQNGGSFFLWAAVANENETGGLQAAKSSMYFLATASGEGMTYPIGDHIQWLTAANFTISNTEYVSPIEHVALAAKKR